MAIFWPFFGRKIWPKKRDQTHIYPLNELPLPSGNPRAAVTRLGPKSISQRMKIAENCVYHTRDDGYK